MSGTSRRNCCPPRSVWHLSTELAPLDGRQRGLAEIRRILKPGGQLAVVKDGHVPGAAGKQQEFVLAVDKAGFVVSTEEHIEAEGVSLTLWICETASA